MFTSDKSIDVPLPAPAPALRQPDYKLRPSSSPKFVGYEDHLHQLEDHFVSQSANGQSRQIFVLYGVGGAGKTQICLRFAERMESNR